MAFVRRLAVGSTVLLMALSSALMYGTRALSGGYGCLHLAELATLVDVHRGLSVPTWYSRTDEHPSPDGRYVAYQTWMADGGYNRLSVLAVGSEEERFLQENIVRFFWSANSRYMAYMWRDGNGLGQFWLTVANADGSDARSTILGPAVSDFYGLSADNQYVAFKTDDQQGSAINFRSVPDFQLTTIDVPGRYPLRTEWSPEGRNLVYPSYNETGTRPEAVWVSVMSPEGGEVRASLPGLPNVAEYTWSPDGRAVGIHYMVQTERPVGRVWQTRLDVIGTDGTVIPEVALASLTLEPPLPPVVWSDDSRSLVVWNGQADGSLSLQRFYHADGRRETIVSNCAISAALFTGSLADGCSNYG